MAAVKGLTTKQKRFAEEYVRLESDPTCGNPVTQAALNAGYVGASVHSTGSNNLRHHKIMSYMAELRQQKAKRAKKAAKGAEISPEYVLAGIAKIADNEEAKDGDRIRAYELLGRYLALFTDKQEVKADVAGEIVLKFDPKEGVNGDDLSG